MECKHVSRLMSARLDGRLDGAEVADLEGHIAGCDACQTTWRKLQALDRLLTPAPMVQAPLRLRVQVMARLERREQARRAIIGVTTLALGTVALALLILAPVLLGLMSATGAAPALVSGGPKTIAQVFTVLCTLGRALLAVLEKLIAPLAALGLCSLALAVAVNRLWTGAVGRTRVTS